MDIDKSINKKLSADDGTTTGSKAWPIILVQKAKTGHRT